MDLHFKVQYKKGNTNAAADALSRHPNPEAVSVSTPSWMDKLHEGYEDNPMAKNLLTELAMTKEYSQGYSLCDGLMVSSNIKAKCRWVIISWLINIY